MFLLLIPSATAIKKAIAIINHKQLTNKAEGCHTQSHNMHILKHVH
ncbi:hypothetical protein NSP_23860 [Nodularia spumigena CCY9414]|nr:hypothetical protein NSP_23860 [Nodularia spumigena CCY9414]